MNNLKYIDIWESSSKQLSLHPVDTVNHPLNKLIPYMYEEIMNYFWVPHLIGWTIEAHQVVGELPKHEIETKGNKNSTQKKHAKNSRKFYNR